MGFAKVHSISLTGIEGYSVIIEADLRRGVPKFELVGLPDAAVKEAKERVKSACKNSGFDFPISSLTVNLAPADIKKEGSSFDLGIFIAMLASMGTVPAPGDDDCFIGELALSGQLHPVNGILSMCIAAREKGIKNVFVPCENAREASACRGINVFPARDAVDVVMHLTGTRYIERAVYSQDEINAASVSAGLDFSDVKGQERAKKAIEIAAAGGHNILLVGPPGSGKSMLAKRIPTILPPLPDELALEVTKIHSVAGTLDREHPIITTAPFRSPHHTMSVASLSGGGRIPIPGEVSLAHGGVLFLDELPEFSTAAMEVLRLPIEDGKISITRVNGKITYPADFMLVAAMNPCKCGYYGHPTHECTCTKQAVTKYVSKISGPLLDRIDIQIEVPSVEYDDLSSDAPTESSVSIKQRVEAARETAKKRYADDGIICNAQLTSPLIRKYCKLDAGGDAILRNAFDKMCLSARGYDRVLKVARTVADLDGSDVIGAKHIAFAVQLRSLDRKYFSH